MNKDVTDLEIKEWLNSKKHYISEFFKSCYFVA